MPHIGPAIRWLVYLVHNTFGVLGVELFFVLSGFLIGNILIKTFISDDFSPVSISNFWIRRWFRTLPLYWLILTANIVLNWVIGHSDIEIPKVLFYVFLQNLWHPHPLHFFTESWSLAVEEWFYLTLPITIFLAARVFKPSNRQMFLLRVFVGYLSVFLLARFINAFHPIYGQNQDAGIRKVVMFRLDAVMYGVLMAWLSNFRKAELDRFKNGLMLLGAAGIASIFYFITDPQLQITDGSIPFLRFASDAFLYLLIPLFFSFWLPFVNGIYTIRNRSLSRFFAHISKISYSMYLVHFSLLHTLFSFIINRATHVVFVFFLLLVYWAMVIAVSTILYKFFELPVTQLRERFSTKEKKGDH